MQTSHNKELLDRINSHMFVVQSGTYFTTNINGVCHIIGDLPLYFNPAAVIEPYYLGGCI
jgi:hypothetical protein